MAEPPNGTVTLLFSDIEGSTRLLERAGTAAYADLLAAHRRLLDAAFTRHDGFNVGSEGDAHFVAFPSADDAAAAAAEAQRALARHDWPPDSEIRVRMGLHSGQPRLIERNYVGLDVHRAARVMAAGHGGQVLLSEATRALLGDGFQVRDLGDHRLKDLAEPQHLYQLLVDGLPTEFPALNTVDNRPTNLPAPPNSFVGRSAELGEIGALLVRDDVRFVTLTGPGGSGKTRLAFEIARAATDDFDNGVFAVSLAAVRDWELVVPTIAQTLGLREQSGERAIETLTRYVRRRKLLLFLDNLEQVIPAGSMLAGMLAEAPGLKILATSRTPLRVSGEHVYAVRPLRLTESVRLFVERAQAAMADFDLTAENEGVVAEICARLEGLPLAIELAAPRVRTLTPTALLRRLDDRLGVLTGGGHDLDERQRTLRATIEWSYDLLTAGEKALFDRLAVFARGSRIEAIEAVCADGASSGTVLDDVESLVEKSLLRRRVDSDGEPRFSMLETIREFALERLEASDDVDERRRLHAGWFASLAESLDAESRSGDQPAAIARLVDDYANLRAAINWSRETGDGELLLALATALWPFWSTHGYVAEGRRALEDAVELTGSRPARALVGLSSLRLFSASGAGLVDDVHEALRAAEELGDPLTLAQAWNLLGRVEGTLMGKMGEAETAWTRALEYADEASLRAERAEAIGWLMMSANFGPLPVEEGIDRCKRFHDAARDEPAIQANACVEHAALEAMRGDFGEARELIAKGRQALADLGFTLLVAMSAQEAHYVERLAGDHAAATAILRESYAELESMGERAYLSTAAALLAHMLYEQGELEEAERFIGASREAAAAEDAFSQLLWRSALAKIRARRGAADGAETLAREAVELADRTDLLNPQGDTRADLSEVLSLAGRPDEAVEALEQAAGRFERKGNIVSLEHVRGRAQQLRAAR